MSACCVSSCKNRYSSTSNIKFYRIPSGSRPFQANRRRLWEKIIKRANGSNELNGNARICGAHFISGEASMDHDSPDFVPSVFACTTPKKQSPTPKKNARKREMAYGRRTRLRRCRTANVETEETPPADDTEDVDLSGLIEPAEDMETPPTSPVSKEGEAWTAEAKTLQFTPSPSKTSPSYQLPAGLPELSKMSPVVRLKSVITPSRGYQCEQCNEKFTDVSQLIKHKRQHEEEKSIPCEICGKSFTSQDLFKEHQCVCAVESSFSCNMCDRTFSTNHNLKRHKLLHVRDGRKCSQCGVLFCRRHNHTVFIPQAELTAESEEDCSVVESENVESEKLMPENDTVEKLEPSQTDDLADDTPSSQPVTTTTSKCLPKNRRAFPLISSADVLTEIPFPKLIKPFRTSLPLIRATSFQFKPREPPNHPKDFIQPHLARDPEISSSLQIFSPQCLTSALLEVKRNYVYFRRREAKLRMMKKQKEEKEREQEEDKVQVQVKMKEEPCEILAVSPVKPRSKAKVKIERTAYDLEIVL